MPTVKDIRGPYRLFFYSFACDEPKHLHIQRDKLICKFWLEPITLSKNSGFSPKSLTLFGVSSKLIWPKSWRHGMNTAADITEPRFLNVEVTEDEIITHLRDGRTISVPLAWSWRLSEATPAQRQTFHDSRRWSGASLA